MKSFLIIPLSISLLTSCVATHVGTISTSSIGKAVSYEDIAYGVSQTQRYFGLGGAGQDAMVLEAKRELIKNRPLKPNEEYANFTLDYKNTYWPFYRQTKVTMSADVIYYTNETAFEPFSENYRSKLLGKNITNDLFNIGDSIVYKDLKEGIIISFENSDNVRIQYKTKKNKLRSSIASINKIYSINKAYKGYKVGDNYVYIKVVQGVEQPSILKVKAVGLNSLLVEDRYQRISEAKYNK